MIELLEHQQEWSDAALNGDLSDILKTHGLPLFGEAGTGKTFPAANVAAELLKRNGGHALFVVPTRLVWNWALEIAKMRPELTNLQILVVNGTRKERRDQLKYFQVLSQAMQMLVIIGYEALRIEQQTFQAIEFTVLVADEAHKIKNRMTQTARALKSVDAKFRFALTGTPITNRPNDLWSILHFLDPGPAQYRVVRGTPPRPGRSCPLSDHSKAHYRNYGCTFCEQWQGAELGCGHSKAGRPEARIRYRGRSPTWGNYEGFEAEYCAREWNGYGWKITGGRNMGNLNARLKHFGATRWLIDDVLKLKPLVFNHIRLEPTSQERQNYRRVQSGIITMLEAGGAAVASFRRLNPLTLLTYLRQCTVLTPTAFAALRGGLLDEILEHTGRLDRSDISSKEEWILDFLESINGEKVLIYGHWIGALDHLMATLERAGVKAVGIYGRHNKKPMDAVRIMQDFEDDPELQVIVGNESMSEGINLQSARYVIFLHLPWIPKDVIQFIGRSRRYGQQKTTIVYFLSQRETIDEMMAQTCMEKQQDSDGILDPEFGGRAGMFNLDTARGLLDLLGVGGG